MTCFKETENFEYRRKSGHMHHRVVVYCREEEIRSIINYDRLSRSFNINLDTGYFSSSPFFNHFDMFRNSYFNKTLKKSFVSGLD